MNKDSIKLCLATFIFGFSLGLWAGSLMEGNYTRKEIYKDAIKHHAAEYQVNPQTGEVQLIWLTDNQKAAQQ